MQPRSKFGGALISAFNPVFFVFAFYGGKTRFGERIEVQTGRVFVVIITGVAYLIALRAQPGIFNLAV